MNDTRPWRPGDNWITDFSGYVVGIRPANARYPTYIATARAANTFSEVQTFSQGFSAYGVTTTGVTGTGKLVYGTSPTIATPLIDMLILSSATGKGIKVDATTPTYPWNDKEGVLNYASAVPGSLNIYRNTIRDYSFSVNDEVDGKFHIPHDYAPGTDIFIHVHWSHIGTAISGNFSGNFKYTYAKGHNQAAFSAEKDIPVTYATVNIATTPRYQHMITEVQLSSAGGSATLLDTALIETDGILLANWVQTAIPTITGTIVEPFIHFVDLHYQSTGIGTKNKSPAFYG